MSDTTINQKFAYIFGAVYVLVGLIGFAVTAGVEFAATEGNLLFGLFEVNPLHNIVHLLVGAAFLIGARNGPMAARATNMSIGAVYLLLGIVGLFMEPGNSANILALNGGDNALHLFTGVAALGVAMYAAGEMTTRRTTRPM